VYLTAGAFPLQENAFGSDKWLFGGQVGVDWGFDNQDSLKVGVAYYDYVDIDAKQNTTVSGTCDTNNRDNDESMPQFMQGGNTLATICREGTVTNPANTAGMVGLQYFQYQRFLRSSHVRALPCAFER
jgi:hypothetical protein